MNSKANILKQLEANTSEALNIASTILDSWGCTDSEKATILGISVNTYLAFKQGWEDIALNARQLECASYIFNIHQTLLAIFSNRQNTNGFMRMVNNNEYFSGRTPLDIILGASCKTTALRQVFNRIDSLSAGL